MAPAILHRFPLTRGPITSSLRALAALACLTLIPATASAGPVSKYYFEPNVASMHMGCLTVGAGDVNGDGFNDIGASAVGGAWLFYGSPLGPFVPTPWVGSGYGTYPAAVGDVNGDGYDDLVTYNASTPTTAGHVYLFAGGPSGLASTPFSTLTNPADSTNWGVVVGAGDVDGDGYNDIIVDADNYGGFQSFGRLSLYRGTPSGLASSPSWTYTGADTIRRVGRTLWSAGDVNGDGYMDIVTVCSVTNDVHGNDLHDTMLFFAGSPSGFPSTPSWAFNDFMADLAAGGDWNGDGYSDCATSVGSGFGSVTPEYFGSSSGITKQGNVPNGGAGMMGDINDDGGSDFRGETDGFTCLCGNPACVPLCGVFPDKFYINFNGSAGTQISAPFGGVPFGDVDGDGHSDLGGGGCNTSNGQVDEGSVVVFDWQMSPVSRFAIGFDGAGASAALGTALSAIGDFNGDGFGDVAVGAPGAAASGGEVTLTGEGEVRVYLGARGGLASVPAFRAFGGSLGAAQGSSLGGLGDVNGDGYSDLIVGVPGYSNGESGEGAARAFYGGAVVDSLPDWSVESNHVNGRMGAAVACVGDVNGDGYADVLVSEPGPLGPPVSAQPLAAQGSNAHPLAVQTADAHVYLYLGSSTGLATSPAWTADGNSYDGFGAAVCGAGDVNRDGYADFAISATILNQVFIYHGGPSGPAGSPAATLSTGGNALAAAGDVNGDGYADLIVGSPNYGGELAGGRAEVFLGSSSGLSTSPAWSVDAASRQALGYALASGDFDDDGYSDVAVGIPQDHSSSGGALIFLGSATGLSTTPAMKDSTVEVGALLGSSLAVGDASGDGYSELFLGAPGHTVSQGGEGRMEERYGYEFPGRPMNVQQLRSNGSAPVDLMGSSGNNAFMIRAKGFNAWSRTPVRLEWQLHALGASWGALHHGPWVDSGTPGSGGSVASLQTTVTGLAANTPYAWRARVATKEPVFYRHSRWLSMQGNGANSADLRTGAAVLGVGSGAAEGAGRLISDLHPNPASSFVRVRFAPHGTGTVTLDVMDVSGRRVRRMIGGSAPNELTWDARDEAGHAVRGGLYFLRATAGARADVRRVAVVR